MALDKDILAQQLWDTLGATPLTKGEAGFPGPRPPSNEIKAYSDGYVSCLKAGVCSFPIPGSITGTGAPLPAANDVTGAGSGGILVVVSSIMTSIATAAFTDPVVISKLTIENTSIMTYLMASGLLSLPSQIIGTNTATTPPPPAPPVTGALLGGTATLGTIGGLDGATLAATMEPLGPNQVSFYTALMNYTMANAQIDFAVGTITGTFVNPPGNIMTLGAAAGGTIS